jgi:type 1 fimbria pilin
VLEQSSNMMVSLITCQVLWNLLISHENQGFDLNQCITSAQRVRLKQVLLNKLDNVHNTKSYTELNECDNNSDEGDNAYSTFKQFSDDFKTVAEDLVEKL